MLLRFRTDNHHADLALCVKETRLFYIFPPI